MCLQFTKGAHRPTIEALHRPPPETLLYATVAQAATLTASSRAVYSRITRHPDRSCRPHRRDQHAHKCQRPENPQHDSFKLSCCGFLGNTTKRGTVVLRTYPQHNANYGDAEVPTSRKPTTLVGRYTHRRQTTPHL